jgi:ribulose 1,5-bisphosphate carboxylase large subunit-like protein
LLQNIAGNLFRLGALVKPKVGLDPAGTAAVASAAVRGGLDLVKDDETLTDQSRLSITALIASSKRVEECTAILMEQQPGQELWCRRQMPGECRIP